MNVDLRHYIERIIEDQGKRHEQQYKLLREEIRKSEEQLSERLRGMNEFRDALKDQAAQMATRNELEKLDKSVRELQRSKAFLDGRLVIFGGAISMIVAIIVSVVVSYFAGK